MNPIALSQPVEGGGAPLFSIIIPTRDRPELLQRALDSVLAQDLDDFEVIVVDDGGRDSAAMRRLAQSLPPQVQLHRLVHRDRGHGPAYSRNFGVSVSRGQYLCFLDDDDLWIDAGHLRRAHDAIARSTPPVDLYFTDQRAVFPNGRRQTQPLWLSGVEQHASTPPDADGNHRMRLEELLLAPGFAHLNCSIYRRRLYDAIDGMDETLRYENDRDLYLRAVDAAEVILYNSAVVSEHNIPDATRASNVSTAVTPLEKKLFQLRICDKAILHSRREAIRRYARRAKGHTLKGIAEMLESAGQHHEAVYYMREALLVAFSFKWLAYTLLSTLPANRAVRAIRALAAA